MSEEEKKDELKNKISMALKDPILQQGFEIICKNLAELEKELKLWTDTKDARETIYFQQKQKIADLEEENAELKEENRQLKNEVEDLGAYCNQIGKIKTDVLKIFEHIVAR